MKHAGGRPTDYDDSFVDKVDKYLQTASSGNMALPTVSGFAIYLGVTKKTLYNWVNAKNEQNEPKHPRFLHSLDKILTYQEQQLINDGIYGGKEVNSTIIKLLLQNNHGYKERSDVTTNDKDIPQPIYGGKSTE